MFATVFETFRHNALTSQKGSFLRWAQRRKFGTTGVELKLDSLRTEHPQYPRDLKSRDWGTLVSYAVLDSRRAVELFTHRYEGGADPYLDVVTAQTTELANERNAVEIQRRRMEASVSLVKAVLPLTLPV